MIKAMSGARGLKIAAAGALLAGLLGMAMLAGCSNQGGGAQAPDESSAQTSAAAQPAAAPSMPDVSADAEYTVEAGDPAAKGSFIVENGTDSQAIFGIAVRPAASANPESAYVSCPFTVGDRLVPQMRCLVHYDAADGLSDVKITFSDGSEVEVLDVDLAALDAPLRIE